MPKEVFNNIPLTNLWIFQGEEPGDLAADRAAAGVQPATEPVVFRLSRSKPVKEHPPRPPTSGTTIDVPMPFYFD